jgi:hypothetical protein
MRIASIHPSLAGNRDGKRIVMGLLDACIAAVLLGYVAWTIRLKGASARIRPPSRDLAWMGVGVALLATLAFLAVRNRRQGTSAEELVRRSERIEQVERMRSMLAAACEAGDGAVMASSESESQALADRSRAAVGELEKARADLHRLLDQDESTARKEALARLSESLLLFQDVQREVLALAMKSTNVKARELAFDPAADAVDRMHDAVDRLLAKSADSPDAKEIAELGLRAEIAARRIQALLAPHIAEARDANMDAMEKRMSEADREARADLERLAAIQSLAGDADREAAASAYTAFAGIETRIIALSRENTNVRSLELSASSMRAARDHCRDALDDLQRSIQEDPIGGVRAGPPFNPRRLRDE